MCGRYYVEVDEGEMGRIVNEIQNRTQLCSGEIYPTNIAPAIGMDGRPQAMKWGFPRYDGKGQVINARSETAGEKAMFRRPLSEGRCLIPASNYFEWENVGGKKKKYALRPEGAEVMYMAALSRLDPETGIPLFVILTRPAANDIAFIHNRMPVILPRTLLDDWLGGYDAQAVFDQAEQRITYRAV